MKNSKETGEIILTHHQVAAADEPKIRYIGDRAAMCIRCEGNARHSYSLDFVLYKSAKKGHDQCVDALLKAGANVNNSWSPLSAAVENGHDKCVDILVTAGADVNKCNDSGSVILLATKYGHEKCVEILARAGADVNNSWNPLFAAVENGHDNCIEILARVGADVNRKNEYGQLVIERAVELNRVGCVRCLIKSGADVNTNPKERLTMFAACRGYHECLEILVEAGVEVNSKDSKGETALFRAVRHDKHRCVEVLLRAGVNVNVRDKQGETPLYEASCKNVKLMLPLLKAGADVNNMDKSGRTALMVAARSGPDDCVMRLLEAGADVNIVDKSGGTALMETALRRSTACLMRVLETGTDVNTSSSIEKTALISTACPPRHKHIESLTGRKVNVNIADFDGWTALHALLINVHMRFNVKELVRAIKALLAAGANVNKITACGETATSLYYRRYHHKQKADQVIMLLFSAGQVLRDAKKLVQIAENRLNFCALCRDTIRKHLLDLDPHENLFIRVPMLGLPAALERYLLYDQTLGDDN